MSLGAAPPGLVEETSEQALERLAKHLGLVAGYSVYILRSPNPRSTRAALARLEERRIERDGRPIRWVKIDPYVFHANLQLPLPFPILGEHVLERLCSPRPEDVQPQVTIVIDASRALPPDQPAWQTLFHRMNERRNLIASRSNVPLLLCLPLHLQLVSAAPDVWSVRTAEITIGDMGAKAPLAREDSAHRRIAAESPADHRQRSEEHARILQAKRRAAEEPNHLTPLLDLGVLMEQDARNTLVSARHRRDTQQRGQALAKYEEAIRTYRGGVDLAHRQLDKAMQGADRGVVVGRLSDVLRAERAIVEGLEELATVLLEVDDLERALAAALEAFERRHAIVERDVEHREAEREHRRSFAPSTLVSGPVRPSPEHLRNEAMASVLLGDVHRARGDLDRALESFTYARDRIEQILRGEQPRMEWMRDRVVVIERIGDVHFVKGDHQEALALHLEELGLAREMRCRFPSSVSLQRDLSVSLDRTGDTYFELGRYDEALRLYEEGLELCRDLVKDESFAEWQRDLSVALVNVAQTHEARGDDARALPLYAEALQIRAELCRRDPEHEGYKRDLARVQQRVEEARARVDGSLGALALPPRVLTIPFGPR
jgi:tetratricopeptide (TPR) repeat protein